ncbi:Gfo/Idh/MocA family protein [Aquisphaera insulae]|uniref:Gfo/Idh/MocA family protein n=1 Tax=Aquisphaera insulae TaxID=2712864 RepID=UPI0013EA1B53|nr:Gfo/Idh/MocA family oxidoreductase [Aquisphaera insulae]
MRNWTRREILAASALGTASLAARRGLAGTSGDDEARPAKAPANESIVLGFIGVGGMGSGLLNIFKGFPDVRVGAVCDVYEPNALRAQSAADGKPEVYHDFRKLLERKDLDAVVVATPDHWHAIPTIHACQAGKDVYCEKPLTHTVAEGRAVVKAAAKHGRVTQMGNLIHAGENYHRVVEIVQSGALGTISKVRVWMAADRSGLGKPADGDPPAGCDYDFWLGPAPKRPFNTNRFLFNWRWFWDYGGGLLTDFCCHIVDPVHWAMGVEAPSTIAATGGRFALVDNGETPDTLEVVYEYEKDGRNFLLVWSHTDANTHGIEDMGQGIMFQGTEATLVTNYNTHKIIPAKGKEIPEVPKSLPRSVGHHREWLDAIKSRAKCSCNFDYGHRLSSVGALGNISLRTGEKLKWDAAAEQFTNHPEANRLLTKTFRAPWALPEV